MRSLKLAGVVACGLALSVTTATAAPQVLDDAALDGVVAGVDAFFPGSFSQSVFGTERPLGSGFPIFAPVVVPERVIEVERVDNSQSTNEGQALTSTSETTGIPAANFLANPQLPSRYLLRFTPFLIQ